MRLDCSVLRGLTRPPHRRQAGFTLIELMITVAVVGILAAVAYPAYTNAMLKGRRAEGRAGLTALMQQQERYFTQNGSYLGFNGPSDAANTTPNLKAYSGDGPNSAYSLGAAQCMEEPDMKLCILVFAKPVRTDPTCGMLVIRSVGLQRGYGTGLSVTGAATTTKLTGGTVATDDASGCWK